MGAAADRTIVRTRFALGKALFEKGKISQARKEFLICVKSYPVFILRAYVYLFFCAVGNRTADVFLKMWRFMWSLFIRRLAFRKDNFLNETSR